MTDEDHSAAGLLAAARDAAESGDEERRQALADRIGRAARALAPGGDMPAAGPEADAWRALVIAADRLHSSGVQALGRLPFVSDRLLARLVEESRSLRPEPRLAAGRSIAAAGDVLAALSVSRQLREAVSAALGVAVEPTYDALYEYDEAGAEVHTHLDARGWEIVVHLLVEHEAGDGGAPVSTLVAHLPGAAAPVLVEVRPGEAVALLGRGTLHSWRPLGAGERRTLTAIGFARESSRPPSVDFGR